MNFPTFQLDRRKAEMDAYGITSQILARHTTTINANTSTSFHDEALRLRDQLTTLYGGENTARYLIHSGVSTFQPSTDFAIETRYDTILKKYDLQNIPIGLRHTAARLLDARNNNVPFKVSFGGYSVTAGRGNYFHQSYPFVLERLITQPMKLLGIELQVRNAAIGGVPSFPYGWCLNNFLGEDADVVSWDFSMNEAGGVADGLEAYLRHTIAMKKQPMLIVKDTSASIAGERRELLQK